MRKPLSHMTAHEFTECQAALGLNSRSLAQALSKSTAAVSGYKSGRFGIPTSVVVKLRELIQHEAERIAHVSGLTNITLELGPLITFQNQCKKPLVHSTEARFMRRQLPGSTKTLPAYRMTARQYRCYLAALADWHQHVKLLARQHHTESRQRDYKLELGDIKVLATNAPRALPYDVCIQVNEWDVVSRALRHHSKTDRYAFSFYQTWRRTRGAGSYLNYRQKQIERRLAPKPTTTTTTTTGDSQHE